METGRYHYVKVAGSKPEAFVKIWLEDAIPIRTGNPISEAELRAELQKDGRTEVEIEEVLLTARENAA
jgi:hypothetical protein